jgi:hypothetical protein
MVKITIHYVGLAIASKIAYFNDLTKLVCYLT